MNLRQYKLMQDRQAALRELHKTLGRKEIDEEETIELPSKPKSKMRLEAERELMLSLGHKNVEEVDEDE